MNTTRNKYTVSLNYWFLRVIFVLVGLSTGPATSSAQRLTELFNELDQNNSELSSLTKKSDAIIIGADQYAWLPDPEFSLGVFPSPVETRLGSQLFRLSATQMIPNKKIATQQKANKELSALPLISSRDAKTLQKRAEINNNWLNLYQISKTIEIIKQNIELLESLEKVALSKVESGKGKMSEVLIIQIKKKEVLDRIKILEAKKAIPTNNINRILNREVDQEIDIDVILDFPDIGFDKQTVISEVIKNHPEINGLGHRKEIEKLKIQLNGVMQKPVYGVGLDYIYVNSRKDAEPSWNGRDIVQLKASVRIPINKKPFASRDKENLLNIEALDLEKKNTQQLLIQKINNAFQAFEMASLEYQLAIDQVKATKAASKLLESEYSSQNTGFENLISMEMNIIQYEKKALESIINAHYAISIIEHLSL